MGKRTELGQGKKCLAGSRMREEEEEKGGGRCQPGMGLSKKCIK